MATNLQLTHLVSVLGRKLATADATTPVEPISLFDEVEITNGTGSNQATEFWAAKGTLSVANSYQVAYDVRDGTLLNFSGDQIFFDKIKGVYILNRGTNAGDTITLQGDFGGFFGAGTHTRSIGPGGLEFATNPIDGWQASTVLDSLVLSSASKTIKYTIALWGTVL